MRHDATVSRTHIVFAHPSPTGFTRDVLDAFRSELSGPSTISDLYAMDFRSTLTLEEYEAPAAPAADVRAEQDKLNAADVWAFIYPVWWTDCPAVLKGWFDRVWSMGFAYKPMTVRPARKAMILCTAGYSVAELEDSGCYAAMRTVMLTDRIGARAQSADFHVLGGRASDPDGWEATRAGHLEHVAALARSLL